MIRITADFSFGGRFNYLLAIEKPAEAIVPCFNKSCFDGRMDSHHHFLCKKMREDL